MHPVESWVLWEGDGLVAVDKPAGLPSTGRTLEDPDCLQSRLIESRGRMVWAVHQLDAETSGVILFATRKSAVERTARRLGRPGGKTYLAVCHGEPEFRQRTVREPIGPGPEAPGRGDLAVRPGGRDSTTRVRVLAIAAGFSLVEARPLTGRTHQVRIHLAHLGHPLIGERRYRRPPCSMLPRQALHAASVELAPLAEGAGAIAIAAPPPADFLALCARLGLAHPALGPPRTGGGPASGRSPRAAAGAPLRASRRCRGAPP